jgi:hypothetical protein
MLRQIAQDCQRLSERTPGAAKPEKTASRMATI